MGINAVCVHGHFYQPPREDPLTGRIPQEPGAQPFKNWNERILVECYQSNARLGNFEKISFNIGPTLLKWMETFDKATYQAIINQENKTFKRNGVGNGMAQAYNHVILPLSKRRDKVTQIKWGIGDFKHRFGHDPSGMWLPETAVDLETLAILADHHIEFTILAPWQVKNHNNLDTGQPYFVKLPGKRKPIIVFLYDRHLSTSVSFLSEATRNADIFVDNWIFPSLLSVNPSTENISLIASDGELYGHHKSFREKFLAHLLNGALHQRDIHITYPALWLRNHKPKEYVQINENTSWSCDHGVMRWRGECACTPGASWKAPLREGLEILGEDIDLQYHDFITNYSTQPWELRDAYIRVLLDEISLKELVKGFVHQTLPEKETRQIGMLLAAQYERQRMFTSCGWFFEKFDRIEPKNNIAYAAQAIWLTNKVTGIDLHTKALALLSKVIDQHTGLSGDVVFSERYKRTQDLSDYNLAYFNKSNNFST